ncbi:hypothetical protein VC83_03704 [Pseudogymnoascus destructans]|uniref:Uncharacterized protein n=1 Tax=Pseudogymnoascus destructans TaxID=655981 RepID=A0A177AEF8_9PEZI|nr:uncharacterized protein VC83_03704 [Pseudogymnoascus destructans]OAF59651.1 hypothetical protein VC83_03704 [Pseudogymnoascus destructans]
MPQPTNTKLMDTSPGGESTNQHVLSLPISITNTPPNRGQVRRSHHLHLSQHGAEAQFRRHHPPRGPALSAAQKTSRERTEHRNQNRRYREAMLEHGCGGTTIGSSHTTTSTSPSKSAVRGTSHSGGGSMSQVAATAEDQSHRHSSYESSPEVEEREVRDRRRQGYGEGSGVGG